MPKLSAGILLYKLQHQDLRLFLVHPGGPFWAKKDNGAWSVPKGEYTEGEDALRAAKREFTEETGHNAPDGELIDLGHVKYNNKVLSVWATPGDLAVDRLHSNTFSLEWPPRSGQLQTFPEVDRAGWFDPHIAQQKTGQRPARISGAFAGQAPPKTRPRPATARTASAQPFLAQSHAYAARSFEKLTQGLPHFDDGRINFTGVRKAPVIVYCRGEILIVKRSQKVSAYQGLWNGISGFIDEPKPIEAFAVQELGEELSIFIAPHNIPIAMPYEVEDSAIDRVWFVYPVLATLDQKPRIVLDWEHTDFAWIQPDQLGRYAYVKDFDISGQGTGP